MSESTTKDCSPTCISGVVPVQGSGENTSTQLLGFQTGSERTFRWLSPVAGLLVILWLLGWVLCGAMNGFIHILLVIAILLVLAQKARSCSYLFDSSAKVTGKFPSPIRPETQIELEPPQ